MVRLWLMDSHLSVREMGLGEKMKNAGRCCTGNIVRETGPVRSRWLGWNWQRDEGQLDKKAKELQRGR